MQQAQGPRHQVRDKFTEYHAMVTITNSQLATKCDDARCRRPKHPESAKATKVTINAKPTITSSCTNVEAPIAKALEKPQSFVPTKFYSV